MTTSWLDTHTAGSVINLILNVTGTDSLKTDATRFIVQFFGA